MEYSGYAYMCSAGESFDAVALAVYGDEKYAAELMTMNPALCAKTVFSGGEKLYLPALDTRSGGEMKESAPWR